MFALQLLFNDASSKPELLFVNQLQVNISGDPSADLVIEDLKRNKQTVQITKGLGRSFKLLHKDAEDRKMQDLLCDFSESIDMGFAKLTVVSLDADLKAASVSNIEKAGLQTFKEAISRVDHPFPALVIRGVDEAQVSFGNMNQVFIGRSSACDIRLRSPEVSGKHCRIGLETDFVWVEDLGSTNGTFVAGRQISGRVNLEYALPIVLGRDLILSVVRNSSELEKAVSSNNLKATIGVEVKYPVLCAYSQVARPGRLELAPGSRFSVGRDPSSDLWLGAPHVSRKHCEIICENDGSIIIVDKSTNGTVYSRGILKDGAQLPVKTATEILNFGNDLTAAICFNAEQEALYRAAKGDFLTFLGTPSLLDASETKSKVMAAAAFKLDTTAGDDVTEEPEAAIEHPSHRRFGTVTQASFSLKNPRELFSMIIIVVLTVAVVVAVLGVFYSFFR